MMMPAIANPQTKGNLSKRPMGNPIRQMMSEPVRTRFLQASN